MSDESLSLVSSSNQEWARHTADELSKAGNLDAARTWDGVAESLREPQQKLHVAPVTLAQAQAFVGQVHRHHPSVHAHKFSTGVMDELGKLRGVAVMGRPGARLTPQYTILEVVRLATDGCPNACSALYGQACRIGVAHGFTHCQTFILDTEQGVSLRAAGWHPVSETRAQKRDRPSRRRKDGLVQIKQRWECRHSPNPELMAA